MKCSGGPTSAHLPGTMESARLVRWRIAAALLVLLAPVSRGGAEETEEKAAQAAALRWLSLVDDGKFEESWNQAYGMFRQAIGKEEWKRALEHSRTPLGKLESRKLTMATHTTQLPGAPEGEYVVLQFATSYANKKDAKETVTPMLDQDGVWRVSGYFVK